MSNCVELYIILKLRTPLLQSGHLLGGFVKQGHIYNNILTFDLWPVRVQGDVMQEVQQQFTPWLSQVVRLYAGLSAAVFYWTVGPIPIE